MPIQCGGSQRLVDDDMTRHEPGTAPTAGHPECTSAHAEAPQRVEPSVAIVPAQPEAVLNTESRLMSAVLLIEPLLTSVLAVRRDSMGTCRPSAGIHLLGLARRSGSCRSCRSEPVSPVSVPLGTDADCGPLVTLRPFAPPHFHRASTLLWPLLTPGSLSRARSPRVRTGTFDPCRQALPDTSFGDDWISRSLARSSPVFGLTACSCSCGRVLATPFFQLGLAASTLGFATLLVTLRGYLLSGNKYMPMSGTLAACRAFCRVEWRH